MQPVVDAFDPRLLVAPSIFHVIDFTKAKVLTHSVDYQDKLLLLFWRMQFETPLLP